MSKVARRAIERAGVDSPSHGAHLSVLCRNRDASSRRVPAGNRSGLTARFTSGDTTLWQVDTELLRLVVRPWPGVEPC